MDLIHVSRAGRDGSGADWKTYLLRNVQPFFDTPHVEIGPGIRRRLMIPDDHLVELALRLNDTQLNLVLCIHIDDIRVVIWPRLFVWLVLGCLPLGDHAAITLRQFHPTALEFPAADVCRVLSIFAKSQRVIYTSGGSRNR